MRRPEECLGRPDVGEQLLVPLLAGLSFAAALHLSPAAGEIAGMSVVGDIGNCEEIVNPTATLDVLAATSSGSRRPGIRLTGELPELAVSFPVSCTGPSRVWASKDDREWMRAAASNVNRLWTAGWRRS